MRVLVQVVKEASVAIDGEEISRIGRGLLLFVGFTEGDDEAICRKMAEKVSKLRIFADENGKINLNVSSVGGEILSVSQFTLYASMREGNRPSFVEAARPEKANGLYEYFNAQLEQILQKPIGRGHFQADMKVSLVNDGPTTVMLDSKELWG